MKSFRDYLINNPISIREGVVKVPPKLYQRMTDIAWATALGVAWDNVQLKKDDYPKFYKWFSTQANKYGVKSANKNVVVKYTMNYDMRGMPKNYPRTKAKRIHLEINTDSSFRPSEGGSYTPSTNTINLSIGRFNFQDYPRPEIGMDEASFRETMQMINTSTIKHELMHSVQYNVLSQLDKKQVDDNFYFKAFGLDKKGKEMFRKRFGDTFDTDLYYNSQLEFDPQIVSAVYEFKDVISTERKLIGQVTQDRITELFKILTGSSKGNREPLPFFEALKRKDMDKWSVAVRKLYVLLTKEQIIK